MKAFLHLILGVVISVLISGVQVRADGCDDKTWIIAVATDVVPAPLPSDDTGEIMKHSFEKIMIPAVCKIANRTCKIVGVKWANFVGTHRGRSFPGKGLLSGNFDALAQVFPSIERLSAMKFSLPFAQASDTGFYVLPGNPHHFNPHGGDFTIGVINGYIMGRQCLNRHKKLFKAVVPLFALEIVDALKSGMVDAIFLELGGREDKNGLEQLGRTLSCTPSGASLATRKDSSMLSWWNAAFKELAHSGQYHHICKKVKDADYPCVKNIKKAIKRFEKNPLLFHQSTKKQKKNKKSKSG